MTEKWQDIIRKAAQERANHIFPVAIQSEDMKTARLKIANKLQIEEVLTMIVDLSKQIDTPEGRGIRAGLHSFAGKVTNERYRWLYQNDSYRLIDDDNNVFMVLGFGLVDPKTPLGELFIVQTTGNKNPYKEIGYVVHDCMSTEGVAEFISTHIVNGPDMLSQTIKKAENPNGVYNIVNEGHAVYHRFGEIFAPRFDLAT